MDDIPMPELTAINGLDLICAVRLEILNIYTTDQLLKRAAKKSNRDKIAKEIWVSEQALHDWVVQADLLRLSDIKRQQIRILRECGINSLKDLGATNSYDLIKKILSHCPQHFSQKRAITVHEVSAWIRQAKRLPAVLEQPEGVETN